MRVRLKRDGKPQRREDFPKLSHSWKKRKSVTKVSFGAVGGLSQMALTGKKGTTRKGGLGNGWRLLDRQKRKKHTKKKLTFERMYSAHRTIVRCARDSKLGESSTGKRPATCTKLPSRLWELGTTLRQPAFRGKESDRY